MIFMSSIGFAVALCVPAISAPADGPAPDQIIEKALRAHGGEEKLNALAGFSLKERYVDSKGTIRSYDEAVSLPNYRSEAKVGPEGKTSSIVVIDGEQGWMKTGSEVISYPPRFAENMRKYTIPYTGPRAILRLRARQRNPKCHFTTVGESTIDGHPAIGLRMKLDGGSQETWYFDTASGLLVRTETRSTRFEGEPTVNVTTYEDYQTVDGFPIARKEKLEQDGKPMSTTELVEFKVATPSEGTFAKPLSN
jgi:hypothetical protein